jgi:hypothetical protein
VKACAAPALPISILTFLRKNQGIIIAGVLITQNFLFFIQLKFL